MQNHLQPIIDTHQHLWDLSRFRLPWLKPGTALAKSHRIEDYLREAAGLNIVKTVYMEVDLAPDQHAEEAEYVIDLCIRDDNPMAGAVISGRPDSETFTAYLDRCARKPHVKGLRQVIHVDSTPPGYCLRPEFVRGVQMLGERGLFFDICIRAAELPDGARLIDACPDTQFVLDHCGNVDVQAADRSQWQADIAAIARRPNVFCKISGIIASARPGDWSPDDLAPIIDHCAEVFGPDRVMFASDWPVCTQVATLREWVTALQQIVSGWPEANQRKLFHDNAASLYGLSAD